MDYFWAEHSLEILHCRPRNRRPTTYLPSSSCSITSMSCLELYRGTIEDHRDVPKLLVPKVGAAPNAATGGSGHESASCFLDIFVVDCPIVAESEESGLKIVYAVSCLFAGETTKILRHEQRPSKVPKKLGDAPPMPLHHTTQRHSQFLLRARR